MFFTGALLLAALAFAGAAALVAVTRLGEHTSAELSDAVGGVRAAEEIEVALLVHNHERTLLSLTGAGVHAAAADAAVQDFERWRGEAEQLVQEGDELPLLRATERGAASYFEAWRKADGAHLDVAAT